MLFNQRDLSTAALATEIERPGALIVDMEQLHRGVPPDVLADRDAPILHLWTVAMRTVPCLVGRTTGHPKLPGTNRMICTSGLWLLLEDQSWARTLSRWYQLGRPAENSDLNS